MSICSGTEKRSNYTGHVISGAAEGNRDRNKFSRNLEENMEFLLFLV